MKLEQWDGYLECKKTYSCCCLHGFLFSLYFSIYCAVPDSYSLIQKELLDTYYGLDTVFDVWVLMMNLHPQRNVEIPRGFQEKIKTNKPK